MPNEYAFLSSPRFANVEPHWKLAATVVRLALIEEGLKWVNSVDGSWWMDRMGLEEDVVRRMYRQWVKTGEKEYV